MLKERIRTLFASYDPVIQSIVSDVVDLEQRYISKLNPRGIKQEIDELVTDIAKQELPKHNNKASEA